MKLDSVHAEVACLQIQWCEFKPPVVYRGKYRQCFSPELHYSQTEGRGDCVARAMKNFRHETKSNFLGVWTDEYRQTHRLLEGDFLALLLVAERVGWQRAAACGHHRAVGEQSSDIPSHKGRVLHGRSSLQRHLYGGYISCILHKPGQLASTVLCSKVQVFVSVSFISAFPEIRHKNLPYFRSYQSNALQHPMWMTVSSQLGGGRERQGKTLLQEVREPGRVTCAQDISKLPLLCYQTCWGSKSRK